MGVSATAEHDGALLSPAVKLGVANEKAHEPIDHASFFGPDALKAIGRAFDESWVSLAATFADGQIETARFRLADVLLSIANDDSRDVETLKKIALDRMSARSS